ncbi:ABC transporter permease [Marinicella rhabdoformis]|uniref:ABC transporter permease n=1 Tax=Marinicella rhabdoformis TaxID=2580566 RepID=UPI0012AEB322|nr:ABC transporter permease subunit [Marinicella rhabdoformis]
MISDKNWGMKLAMLWLLFVILVSVFGPLMSNYLPETIHWDVMAMGPNSDFWLGTDVMGRDVLVRTLLGGQTSLMVALIATLVSVIMGVVYGVLAGFYGGRIDAVMMRIVDVMYALPFMFLVILLLVFFGQHLWLIFVGIGAYMWLDMARIVRGQTLALKQQAFVEAAFAMGQQSVRIMSRHILPNLLPVILVYATLTIPQVILVESFLSFLGLGVQEPMTSWGVLVSEGAENMELAPWALIFPGLFLSLTLLSFNRLGDGLRDCLDPKNT